MKSIFRKSLEVCAIVLLAVGIFSCTPNRDPLSAIKFGQDSISHVRKIIDEIDDSWALQKYAKYIYDNYDNQITSKVSIVLRSDSSYLGSETSLWSIYGKGSQSFALLKSMWEISNKTKKYHYPGPLPSSTVDSLWDLYHKWYGTPDHSWEEADTIYISRGIVVHGYRDPRFLNNRNISQELITISDKSFCCLGYDIIKQYANSNIDTMIIDRTNIKRMAIWNTENYQVNFSNPFKYRYIHDTTDLYYEYAEINYQMHNYEEVREHMEDSIRKTYQINDLIYLNLHGFGVAPDPKYHWTDYGWFAYTTIGRPANLDQRIITSVRYEIIMKDDYDEILYRSTPQTLDIVKDAREGANTQPMRSGMTFYHSYVSFLVYDSKLLQVRNYAKQNNVKYSLRPLAVVFSDGKVLRRND
ncbi:hypothetical protein [Odoribacter splanchnicus]|jgi:hypothetical protein|uniref:Uncharacterized protein n=1 Tax=Odoribacter splanchnicus TaxID=28118 RepID=A0A413I415_9BACT|nr:hypothetical protein [Odoribacter splanchnicus]RGY02118.1 hypothetical protein DXA53_19885 [Odoribacter splanchnicus]RHL83753.1 hypothetical protein DWZ99_09880 [Odoribacter splanchnicus]